MSDRLKELRKKMQETSREELILSEMQRLGFWDKTKSPPVVTQFLEEEHELSAQLRTLVGEKKRIEDRERLMKEIRVERMKASLERRKESKLKKIEARAVRSAAWKAQKAKEITYLGSNYSYDLGKIDGDDTRLENLGLPIFKDVEELATYLETTVSELRFLAFSREVSKHSHYVRFTIPKKTGGERLISAPMPRLKTVQYQILDKILQKIPLHDAAHGFVPSKSIVSNAAPHLGAKTVINLDFKDFFPSISYVRVKGIFLSFGYSPQIATILALICTEMPSQTVEMDGETWHIGDGERHLPQGAPTSPMLTNILCRKLDARLVGLAASLGFIYTRYADDLTFSCQQEGHKAINILLQSVQQICADENLQIHPDKTRVMRPGSKKEVTGVVVNDKLGVDRKKIRKFRAFLHQVERDGSVAGKTWGNINDPLESALGFARYVQMVDAEKGAALLAETKAIIAKVKPNYQAPKRKVYPKKSKAIETLEAISSSDLSEKRAERLQIQAKNEDLIQNEAPKAKKPWWKFW